MPAALPPSPIGATDGPSRAAASARSATRVDFGRVSVFLGDRNGKYPDGNQVIVRGSDTVAVFDTPLVSNRIGRDFDDADLVILGHVHEDHLAGLHRLPSAPVHVHEGDVEAARSWDGLARHYGLAGEKLAALKAKVDREFCYVERPDAIAYRDGARWDLGGSTVRAVHMPGHTSGHCVLLVEPEGIAFIGDIDLSTFGPYYGDATSSLADFRRTLARLPGLPARAWVTSHHRGIVEDRAAFLEALAAFSARIDAREARVLALLAEAPRTLDDLVRIRMLYPPGFDEIWVEDAERRSFRQHLDELLAAGRIAVDPDGRYRLA